MRYVAENRGQRKKVVARSAVIVLVRAHLTLGEASKSGVCALS